MDRSLAEKGWMFSTWLDPVGDTARGSIARPPQRPTAPGRGDTALGSAAAPPLTVLAPDDVSDSDAPDLRVTEAQQEGPVRLRAQELADVLLADEADDEPRGAGRRTVGQRQGRGRGPGSPGLAPEQP